MQNLDLNKRSPARTAHCVQPWNTIQHRTVQLNLSSYPPVIVAQTLSAEEEYHTKHSITSNLVHLSDRRHTLPQNNMVCLIKHPYHKN